MLFISHRIVGPIYRLKKEIVAFKNGFLKRNFKTREKDQLKDLANELQEMTDNLHSKQGELRSNYEALANFLEKEKSSLEWKRGFLKGSLRREKRVFFPASEGRQSSASFSRKNFFFPGHGATPDLPLL